MERRGPACIFLLVRRRASLLLLTCRDASQGFEQGCYTNTSMQSSRVIRHLPGRDGSVTRRSVDRCTLFAHSGVYRQVGAAISLLLNSVPKQGCVTLPELLCSLCTDLCLAFGCSSQPDLWYVVLSLDRRGCLSAARCRAETKPTSYLRITRRLGERTAAACTELTYSSRTVAEASCEATMSISSAAAPEAVMPA